MSAPADTAVQFQAFLSAVDVPSARHTELASLDAKHKASIVERYKTGDCAAQASE